jgi:hypothetical protein
VQSSRITGPPAHKPPDCPTERSRTPLDVDNPPKSRTISPVGAKRPRGLRRPIGHADFSDFAAMSVSRRQLCFRRARSERACHRSLQANISVANWVRIVGDPRARLASELFNRRARKMALRDALAIRRPGDGLRRKWLRSGKTRVIGLASFCIRVNPPSSRL